MAAPADYAQQATVCESKAVRVDIDAVPLFGDAPIECAEQLSTVGGDMLLVAPSRNQGILAGGGSGRPGGQVVAVVAGARSGMFSTDGGLGGRTREGTCRRLQRDGVAWVRVVIVNHNSGRLLGETIAALAGQTDGDFEAVIVDNASTDGSAAVRLPDCRFRVVDSGKNLGFAAGCNLGSRDARTPWLAMLNPDAIPEPGWLASLAEAIRRYPEAAAFGSTQLDAENPKILDGAGDNYSIYGLAWRGGCGSPAGAVRGDARVFSACAAAALYRRDVFEAAGGFAETFFCYLEDVDLGFRLNLLGYEAIQLAEARVRHVGSACSGGKTSRFAVYHGLRNSVFVCVRCMPFPLVLAALPLLVVSQVWIGVRVGQLKLRMEAVRDGLACLPRLLGERREIQAKRRMGAGEVARLVVWSARTVNRLRIVPLRRCQNPH